MEFVLSSDHSEHCHYANRSSYGIEAFWQSTNIIERMFEEIKYWILETREKGVQVGEVSEESGSHHIKDLGGKKTKVQ